MDHLGGIDASFLYLETPEMPMHVGGLNIFELPPGYQGDFLENVRRHIQSRMHLAPVFQRKLLNMPFELANPVWVADDDLDLEYHIRSTVLPKPGNRAQLDHLVGRLHSSQLDRSRPLWEFYVIEGVENPPDAPKGTRRVAFYSKVHHAALDGEGGAVLAQSIMDITPVPRTVRPAPPRRPMDHDTYGIAELVGAGLKNSAVQAAKLARALPSLLRSAAQILRPAPGNGPDGAEAATPGPAASAPRGLKGALGNQWFGPRTPINVSVTNQRIFSSLSLPLADIKHIAKSHGVTLNDVVMAICSSALRHYLADLGCVPGTPLLAGVPVSLREKGNTEMNTQASMMRVSLASNIDDPLERLQAIRQSSLAAKAMTASMKSAMPMDFPSLGAPWLISGMASLYSRSRLANRLPPVVNVAISNVPGPKIALYLAGAKMLTYYPVSIAGHSMALNVTVQSYGGSLDFGLTACRKAMPDLPELARYMQAAYEELRQLTPAAMAADPASALATHPAPMKKAGKPSRPRAPAPKAAAVKTARADKARTGRRTAAPKTTAALQLVAGQPKPARAARPRRAAS
ncbi:MAG TPA: wax ester/triacylglycerol synthase family O-acyltransferase [Rhodoferax sp.]|nr:wax ester/triacylglycerol synthase family O-acyltransferase [Rhodoferax sp.]